MTVVFLILKIIGIILAVLLGLIVLAIVLVLFCPFHYRIRGTYHEKPDISIKIAWLLHIFQFRMDITETQQMYLRIFGFRKNLSENEEDACDQEEECKTANREEPPVVSMAETRTFEKAEAKIETEVNAETEIKENGESLENETAKDFFKKIQHIFHKIKKALSDINATAAKVKKLYKDPRNKLAFTKLKQAVVKLFRVIHPRKFRLQMKFSTGSPDTTGQALGVIAMFPIGYRNGWNVVPDFTTDHFYVDAEFDVRGHVFGINLLRIACSIILDKNCKRLYNKVTSIFK